MSQRTLRYDPVRENALSGVSSSLISFSDSIQKCIETITHCRTECDKLLASKHTWTQIVHQVNPFQTIAHAVRVAGGVTTAGPKGDILSSGTVPSIQSSVADLGVGEAKEEVERLLNTIDNCRSKLHDETSALLAFISQRASTDLVNLSRWENELDDSGQPHKSETTNGKIIKILASAGYPMASVEGDHTHDSQSDSQSGSFCDVCSQTLSSDGTHLPGVAKPGNFFMVPEGGNM